MDKLFGNTLIPLLSKSLDVAMLRQRSTASNIANITTPDYRRTEVRFEEKLQNVVDRWHINGKTTHNSHRQLGQRGLASVTPEVIQPLDAKSPSGINNVDLDHEMANLSKNQLKYQLNIRLLTKGFSALKTSIIGHPGGRHPDHSG